MTEELETTEDSALVCVKDNVVSEMSILISGNVIVMDYGMSVKRIVLNRDMAL